MLIFAAVKPMKEIKDMKEMISIVPFRAESLNTAEYAQLMKEFLKLLHHITPSAIHVEEEVLAQMESNLELLTDVMYQSRRNANTENITKLDKERTKIVSYLLYAMRNEQKHIDTARSASAQLLYKELKAYKSIKQAPLRQKTSMIDALLVEFGKNEIAISAELMGFSPMIDALKRANEGVQKLLSERLVSQHQNKQQPGSQIRKELHQHYKYVVRCAEATFLLEQSESIKQFIALTSKLITDVRTKNKSRLHNRM